MTTKETLDFLAFAAEHIGKPLYELACTFWGCESSIPGEVREALRAAARADLPKHMAEVDREIDARLPPRGKP